MLTKGIITSMIMIPTKWNKLSDMFGSLTILVNSSTRTLLTNDTMNNLLEVKLYGPSIEVFSPATAIMHWLENGPGKRHIDGHKTEEKNEGAYIFFVNNVNKFIFRIYI